MMKIAPFLLVAAVVAAAGWHAGLSDAGSLLPVGPKAGPVGPKLGPVRPKLGPVRPKIAPSPARPKVGRIAVMVLENRSYEQIIGNPDTPYINSLARHGALATEYYAITHPSLPNYIAMTTGGHKGIKTNCATCKAQGRSLVNQLDGAHIPWRAYFESLPARVTSPYVKGAAYNRHYNPFVYSETLDLADLTSNTVNFGVLSHDLATDSLRRFSWIAPNIWHDGHNAKLAAVDRFAARLVPRVVRALGPRGVLFITWDEGRRSDIRGAGGEGGGRIPLIAVGPGARAGARVRGRANHYAFLKTIEASLGLRALGHARGARTPMLSGLLRP
jgi:phosphatidylinositol-3-phosphatase